MTIDSIPGREPILSAYFYVLMEWVFFVTKPSSISNLPWLESVKVLILTGGALALFPLGGVLCLLIPALIVNRTTWRNRILRAGYIFPAFVLSVTALIMLDNFTYTIFKVGSSRPPGRSESRMRLALSLFICDSCQS